MMRDKYTFWTTLAPGEILGPQEHFELLDEMLAGKIRVFDFCWTYLKSFAFQYGNLSQIEEDYFLPIAGMCFGYLFDPGYDYNFMHDLEACGLSRVAVLHDFFATPHSLMPLRTAILQDTLVYTGRSRLLPTGVKGVEVFADGDRSVVPMSSLHSWTEESFTALEEPHAERWLHGYGTNQQALLVQDPQTWRLELLPRERAGEVEFSTCERERRADESIWGCWGPSEITCLSPEEAKKKKPRRNRARASTNWQGEIDA